MLTEKKVYSANGVDYIIEDNRLTITDGVRVLIIPMHEVLYRVCDDMYKGLNLPQVVHSGMKHTSKLLLRSAIAHHFPENAEEKNAIYVTYVGGVYFRAFKRFGNHFLAVDFEPYFEYGLRTRVNVRRRFCYDLKGRPSLVNGSLIIPSSEGELRFKAIRIV